MQLSTWTGWCGGVLIAVAALFVFAASSPGQAHVTKEPKARDGTEVTLDLPRPLQLENAEGSDGYGLCVFTSIARACLWQNIPALQGLRDYMRSFPGGGFPEKVDAYVSKLCKSLGEPVPKYLHYRGRSLEPIRRALKTGRMACVTYGVSPTYRYSGKKIYHMVNVVAAGEGQGPDGKGWWCVSDNNYPGTFEWMSEAQFLRSFTFVGDGWAVFLLAPCPPPVPSKGQTMNATFFSLVAAVALGQCENGKCLIPATAQGVVLAPIGQAVNGHQWAEPKGEKAARLYRNNILVGQFDYVTGTYHPWTGNGFGEASMPPVDPPITAPGMCAPSGESCDFGVKLDDSRMQKGFKLNDKAIGEQQAFDLLRGDESRDLTDDTDKHHLTIVVKGAEARRSFDAWAKSEAKLGKYRVQVYDATSRNNADILSAFRLDADNQFAAKGTAAFIQAPGTTKAAPILAKMYGFANPDGLQGDIRKVDPNFDPVAPLPKPLPIGPAVPANSSPPWWMFAALAGVVVVVAVVGRSAKL